MRIGDLVEHDQRAGWIAVQDILDIDIFERCAFKHQSLMRRIFGHEPAEIGCLGIFQRKIWREFAVQRFDTLARCPELAVLAVWVAQRRFHRMAAPKAHRASAGPPGAAPALHPPGAPAQGPGRFAVDTLVHLQGSIFVIAPPLPARPLTGKARFVIERPFPQPGSNELGCPGKPHPACWCGQVAEWLKAADCKSARASVRWFESSPVHHPLIRGCPPKPLEIPENQAYCPAIVRLCPLLFACNRSMVWG